MYYITKKGNFQEIFLKFSKIYHKIMDRSGDKFGENEKQRSHGFSALIFVDFIEWKASPKR